jgi:pimeloyl-ACP methyl ester carboxylesterase
MDVLAPDQRGHGKSQISSMAGGRSKPCYTPLDYGQDIMDTMDSIQFSPAWIVGHSMGVRSAIASAHLNPEKIKGLILVDLGFSGVAGGGLGENLAQFIRILPQEFSSREAAKLFMASHCPDPSIAQYLMAVSVRTPEGTVSFPFDHGALIETIHAARDVSVRGWVRELASKKLPILVLRGEKSLVWSHEQFEQERSSFSDLPSIRFQEIPDAGHGLPFEKRTLFVECIRNFIRES